jgi:hypothetical protein
MREDLRRLSVVLRVGPYRRIAVGIAALYLPLFLFALQDISVGGHRFEVLTTHWTRMLDRTGTFTFEAVAQVTFPGLTILVSPLNLTVGVVISSLVGLNLALTYLAMRQPRACSMNRGAGVLSAVPALLAGSACCVPSLALILGLQLSSLSIAVFQVLIPLSLLVLLMTLKLILSRTNVDAVSGSSRTR